MRCLNNDKGFALITSLMITLLSLVIVLGILYSVTRGITTTASQRAYRNAVEASYGAANVTMYEVLPQLAHAILEVAAPDTGEILAKMGELATDFQGINLSFKSSSACLSQKLLSDSSGNNWNACSGYYRSVRDKDIKNYPDMSFILHGTSGATFTVYSKIVDTIPGTTYMTPLHKDTTLLADGGVVNNGNASSAGSSLAKHFVYRIEVIGQKTNNLHEQGNLSVLYEY